MPQRIEGADLPSSASAAWKTRNVAGGMRPAARQLETDPMELPVNRAVAAVPPTASITSEAVESPEVAGGESSITRESIQAAFIAQVYSAPLWKRSPDFEIIGSMAARQESPESTQAVAARLRLTRQAFNMKKATWCRFVDMSPQAWNNVEGTETSPASNRISLDEALKVCRTTGVGLNWIFRGNRDDVPYKVALALHRLDPLSKRKTASKKS